MRLSFLQSNPNFLFESVLVKATSAVCGLVFVVTGKGVLLCAYPRSKPGAREGKSWRFSENDICRLRLGFRSHGQRHGLWFLSTVVVWASANAGVAVLVKATPRDLVAKTASLCRLVKTTRLGLVWVDVALNQLSYFMLRERFYEQRNRNCWYVKSACVRWATTRGMCV